LKTFKIRCDAQRTLQACVVTTTPAFNDSSPERASVRQAKLQFAFDLNVVRARPAKKHFAGISLRTKPRTLAPLILCFKPAMAVVQ